LQSLILACIVLFVSACGVDTSSSVSSDKVVSSDTNTTAGGGSVIGDTNTTSGDTNTTDVVSGDTNTTLKDKVPDTAFDYVDAVEDPNACTTRGYRVASDASYDGSSPSENGASGFIIADQGLVIRSEYLSQENSSTWVTLFYKGFPTIDDLNLQGVTSYKMDGVFYLSFDKAWSDKSIPDVTNRMYLQSKKDEVPDCYRLDLNNTIGSRIGVQKVYRLRQ